MNYLKEKQEKKSFNIVIVDDESLIRLSHVRIFQQTAKRLNIGVNIIQAEDGIESAYLIYYCTVHGVKIDLIFSDECMFYIKGTQSARIIRQITDSKNLPNIPFYLVTAFEKNYFSKLCKEEITNVLQKPLTREDALKLLSNYLN